MLERGIVVPADARVVSASSRKPRTLWSLFTGLDPNAILSKLRVPHLSTRGQSTGRAHRQQARGHIRPANDRAAGLPTQTIPNRRPTTSTRYRSQVLCRAWSQVRSNSMTWTSGWDAEPVDGCRASNLCSHRISNTEYLVML